MPKDGITITEKNNVRRVMARVKEVTTSRIRVGIVGKGESFFAMLGAVHEFGTNRAGRNRNVTIPERSFLRSTIDDRRETKRAMAGASAVFDFSVEAGGVLDVIGLTMAAAVRRKIRSNLPPKLKAATIKRKGSSVALIDSGALVNRIQHEVTK